MKRILTTILLATVLAGIPVFATALNRTERKAGLTSALANPAPASPQYRRRRYRRRYVFVRRRVYRRRAYRRVYLYRRGTRGRR
ncbi:MAG TPA: hypothetical protein VHE60_00455 [Pyrinomonadaceae bacterium]|nr:hypothetical protein [Pyrinomonadaceae bacterium]